VRFARCALLQTIITASQSGAGAGEDEEEVKKGWKFGRNEGPMSWPWKLMCAILYMLPWVDVTEKTVYFIERFPAFHWTEYFTGETTRSHVYRARGCQGPGAARMDRRPAPCTACMHASRTGGVIVLHEQPCPSGMDPLALAL
jgi:hypothetical protein